MEELEGFTDATPEGVQVEEKPKRKGGRPKGSKDSKPRRRRSDAKTKPTPKPKKEESSRSVMDEIESVASEYKQPPPPPDQPEGTTGPQSESDSDFGDLVNGYILLIMIEAFIPSLVVGTVNIIRKKQGKEPTKAKAADIKMTDRQKKDLEPIADAAAKYLLNGMKPHVLLIIAISGVYMTNMAEYK